ncbi:hypothetical protein SSX86_033025 [Deinandra increscens subsp. villosa]|uniref:Uncharacterized protein n=1 Tax=Deinandra increscens subsp. villosa TaxID=3103831 RepID=A0AAP0GG87_9ASTR
MNLLPSFLTSTPLTYNLHRRFSQSHHKQITTMDVAPAIDFDFNTSSYNHYASAPSSPTRLHELYCGFDELLIAEGANRSVSLATVPFAWEEKPGVPKASAKLLEDEFSFDVSFDCGSVPAEDLFQGGVIKAINHSPARRPENKMERERGRERGFSSSRLPSRSRRTRSLSPLGFSDYRREEEATIASIKPQPSGATCSSEHVSKRWWFKDLFLFRSASDGRAMDKDPLKKFFSPVLRKSDQDFRKPVESGSTSKRRGRVSAHEVHYNLNRANLNEMKKKTYLPYKSGILGGF